MPELSPLATGEGRESRPGENFRQEIHRREFPAARPMTVYQVRDQLDEIYKL